MIQTKNSINIKTLKRKIAAARKRLNALWDDRGCTDYDVIIAGMELDKLINEYQQQLRVMGNGLRVK